MTLKAFDTIKMVKSPSDTIMLWNFGKNSCFFIKTSESQSNRVKSYYGLEIQTTMVHSLKCLCPIIH